LLGSRQILADSKMGFSGILLTSSGLQSKFIRSSSV
jgi:hypothetical protein